MLVVAVLVAVGLTSLGLLLVLVVGLTRHVRLLAGSLARFQEETRPLLEELQAGGVKARERMEELAERRGKDATNGRSPPDLGARLRS